MTSKVVLFQLRGESRALFLAAIDQISMAPQVFRLPLLPSNFEGVFLHKGQVTPVLTPDCWSAAVGSFPTQAPAYFIVCTTEFGQVGLPADRVIRIVALTTGHLEVADSADPAGIFCFEGERYPLVKLETLLGLQPCNQG